MKMHILLLSLISVISLQGMEKKAIITVEVGGFTCQNGRPYQEDASVIKQEENGNCFLGVFDGHGENKMGACISGELKNKLHGYFDKQQQGDITQKLRKGCNEFNEEVCKDLNKSMLSQPQYAKMGSTAIIAYIDVANNKLFFANVGDSRAVYSTNGKVFFATKDHKPSDEGEEKRIQEAGGMVIYKNGTARLNRYIAVSRAFGDVHIGKGLIADPDITTYDEVSKGQFIILASDGLWNKVTSAEAVEFVNQYLKNDSEMEKTEDVLPNSSRDGNDKLSYIAELLAREAIKRGSGDNITVIVAQLGGNDSDSDDKSEIAASDQSDSERDDNNSQKNEMSEDQVNDENNSNNDNNNDNNPQDNEISDAQVNKSWNLFPSFITKHPWMSGGIVSLALLGGLICYLKYIR